MTTTKNDATKVAADTKPVDLWATSEALIGDEPTDKAILLRKAFVIFSVEFSMKPGRDGGEFPHARISAQYRNGDEFWFQDASTGVTKQLVDYLGGKGIEPDFRGGFYPMALRCLNGLRVSEYPAEVKDAQGAVVATRMAKTYYIVTERDR